MKALSAAVRARFCTLILTSIELPGSRHAPRLILELYPGVTFREQIRGSEGQEEGDNGNGYGNPFQKFHAPPLLSSPS